MPESLPFHCCNWALLVPMFSISEQRRWNNLQRMLFALLFCIESVWEFTYLWTSSSTQSKASLPITVLQAHKSTFLIILLNFRHLKVGGIKIFSLIFKSRYDCWVVNGRVVKLIPKRLIFVNNRVERVGKLPFWGDALAFTWYIKENLTNSVKMSGLFRVLTLHFTLF